MKRAVILLPLLLLASPAFGQQDVIKLAEKLNKKAMEDYDALEFDSAKNTLLSAQAKLVDAGQDETPTGAKICVNLGIVYILGFKDRTRGIQQFVKALRIDGTIALDPERVQPELTEAFEAAQKQAGVGGADKPPETPPEKPPERTAPVRGLQHTVVDEANAGMDTPIKAQLGSDVRASNLYLFYRPAGQEEYVAVPMRVDARGDWVGMIPGTAMEGNTLQYYLEARDSKGRPVVAHGSAANPNIISIREQRIETEKPPLGETEKPPRGGGKKGTQPASRGWGRLFVNIMFGTAIGIQKGGNTTEVAHKFQGESGQYIPQDIESTGTVFQPFHLALEAGVNITKHIGLSGVFRIGFTLLNNAEAGNMPPLGEGIRKAISDASGMLRARFQFPVGRVKPFLHLGFGGGEIRHVLDLSASAIPGDRDGRPLADKVTAVYYMEQGRPPQKNVDPVNAVCPMPSQCWDSVVMGNLLVGVGGGIFIEAVSWQNGGFGLLLDADLLLGFPVTPNAQFGTNIDVRLGLGAHFL